jgi:hypothetical protein
MGITTAASIILFGLILLVTIIYYSHPVLIARSVFNESFSAAPH